MGRWKWEGGGEGWGLGEESGEEGEGRELYLNNNKIRGGKNLSLTKLN